MRSAPGGLVPRAGRVAREETSRFISVDSAIAALETLRPTWARAARRLVEVLREMPAHVRRLPDIEAVVVALEELFAEVADRRRREERSRRFDREGIARRCHLSAAQEPAGALAAAWEEILAAAVPDGDEDAWSLTETDGLMGAT